jgi:hypothetical protein
VAMCDIELERETWRSAGGMINRPAASASS